MKNLFKTTTAAALLTLATQASAQVETISWEVQGINILPLTSIELDIRLDGKYYLASGAVFTNGTDARPATGSCFDADGTIICDIDVLNRTYELTINDGLNGTLRIIDLNLDVLDEGTLIFSQ